MKQAHRLSTSKVEMFLITLVNQLCVCVEIIKAHHFYTRGRRQFLFNRLNKTPSNKVHVIDICLILFSCTAFTMGIVIKNTLRLLPVVQILCLINLFFYTRRLFCDNFVSINFKVTTMFYFI